MKPKKLIDEKGKDHIFRDSDGHLIKPTAENQKKLEDVPNDPSSYLGNDRYGNEWHATTKDDGSQIWTQSRGDKIINGGINPKTREYNSETGLSSSTVPNNSNSKKK